MSGRLQRVKGLNRYYRPIRQQAAQKRKSSHVNSPPQSGHCVTLNPSRLLTGRASTTMAGQ
jgi:hypothetical protein